MNFLKNNIWKLSWFLWVIIGLYLSTLGMMHVIEYALGSFLLLIVTFLILIVKGHYDAKKDTKTKT